MRSDDISRCRAYRRAAIIQSVSRWFRSYGFADVFDDLIVGAYPLDQDDVDTLARLGIARVLNLTEDDEYPPGDRPEVVRALAGAGIAESRLPLTDYGGLPARDLETAVRAVSTWLDQDERTYVHCRAGWQGRPRWRPAWWRPAPGWTSTRRSTPSASASRRPTPFPHQREDLRRWWDGRRGAGGAP